MKQQRTWTDRDRLELCVKPLLSILERADISAQIHPIIEIIKFLKKECGYKSLNYPIVLTCLLDDEETQMKLLPFLPRSDVAWARSFKQSSPVLAYSESMACSYAAPSQTTFQVSMGEISC